MGGFHSWILTLSQFSSIWAVGALWVIYSLYLALFYALFGAIAHYLKKHRGSRYNLGIASAFVITEVLRQSGPIGSPGGILGYSQIAGILAPMSSWTGITGVSFIVVLLASCLLQMQKKRVTKDIKQTNHWPYLGLSIVFVFLFLSMTRQTPKETGFFIASSIQGNHSQHNKITRTNTTNIQNYYLRQTQTAIEASANIIVWPETITPVLNTHNRHFMMQLQRTLKPDTVVFWGTPTWEHPSFHNSIVMTTQESPSSEIYHKSHLVPFGEYWPLKQWFRKLGLSNIIPGAEYSPGPPPGDIFSNHFSGSICLESVYGHHFRQQVQNGSQGFVISGNHGWYGNSSASAKQLDMIRFRAIEYGRSIVFATNSGSSALILPNGHLAAVADAHQKAVITARLPKQTHLTIYARYGEWFSLLCLILLVGSLMPIDKLRRYEKGQKN